MQEKRSYVVFPALTRVLKAEKCLTEAGIRFCVAPIPREITSDCGMCIVCPPDCLDEVLRILEEKRIEYSEVHTLQKKKFSLF